MADAKAAPPPAWLDYVTIFGLGIIVMPAMWFMAYMYSTWETWIKENGDFIKKPIRAILIIPFSILMVLSMIIYHGLHDTFKNAISRRWGLKLF
jgi:glucose-6-phosphate-specific signal transduction histidine kinase